MFLGKSKDILVDIEDPLPAVEVPARDCGSGARIGTRVEVDPAGGHPVRIHVHAPADAGRLFRVGLSLAKGPGRALDDGRNVPLVADELYELSVAQQEAFFPGAPTRLDGAGRAVVPLTLHRVPEARGRTIYYAVRVFEIEHIDVPCRMSVAGALIMP